jgi:CRISPR/Cas system endoribonuclease Cas6 (RAMP superfamily)
MRWQAGSRYSATHGKSLDTGGWMGHLELDIQGLDELWPYLWLGQWLNVGKNASMGFGRYSVVGI